MPSKIKSAQVKQGPLFTSWAEKDSVPNVSALAASEPIFRSQGSNTCFTDGNVTYRERCGSYLGEYANADDVPTSEVRKIISKSMWAYKRIGVLKNVVDLMSDFSCQGIEIVHPNKKIERFLQYWAKKVGFKNRSERFVSVLLRAGNVVVQKGTAQLRKKDVDRLQRGQADADMDVTPPPKILRNEIPWNYVINSPLNIQIIGGEELAIFAGKVRYAIKIPSNIISKIKNPKNNDEKELVNLIPDYIVAAVKAGKKLVPLNQDKVSLFSYKKDDWDALAEPLAAPILDDLIALNKLKRADLAALDGAISHVRVWKLGSLEHKLYPTEAAVARLSEMLAAAVGGGALDIIWGPDLELKETATDIYKFLGSEKYGPTLTAIYDGLGIPIALTSYSTSKGGATSSYLSLQTLIERLDYIRGILVEFWDAELKDIQQAFGFRDAASIRFSRLTLTDEAAQKALLIQLADRNLISIETLQERFGEIPELELLRQRREQREIDNGKRLRRASQWHNPEQKEALQKIALQTGAVTPSEVGLELDERTPGQTPAIEVKLKSQEANKVGRGVPGQGRPGGSKDKSKRKKKNFAVQKSSASQIANTYMWVVEAQKNITNILNDTYLDFKGKKSLTSLSNEEFTELENLKFAVLCNCKPYTEVTKEVITELLSREEKLLIPEPVYNLYLETSSKFTKKFNREPVTADLRQIQASVYALYIGEL